jgi:hypothetical protein
MNWEVMEERRRQGVWERAVQTPEQTQNKC